MSSVKCLACGEYGHRLTRCPALRDPLREGFQGGGGGGGHSHGDDEDERLRSVLRPAIFSPILRMPSRPISPRQKNAFSAGWAVKPSRVMRL